MCIRKPLRLIEVVLYVHIGRYGGFLCAWYREGSNQKGLDMAVESFSEQRCAGYSFGSVLFRAAVAVVLGGMLFLGWPGPAEYVGAPLW